MCTGCRSHVYMIHPVPTIPTRLRSLLPSLFLLSHWHESVTKCTWHHVIIFLVPLSLGNKVLLYSTVLYNNTGMTRWAKWENAANKYKWMADQISHILTQLSSRIVHWTRLHCSVHWLTILLDGQKQFQKKCIKKEKNTAQYRCLKHKNMYILF